MFGQLLTSVRPPLGAVDHDALLFAPRLEPTGVGSRQMDMTSLSRRIKRPRVHHRGRLPDLLPLVVAALVASAPNSLVGQAPSTPIDCAITLDSLDARVRRNYAGYMLEVATHRRVQYTTHLTAAQEAARVAALSTEACTRVLRAYIAWFDDPHLFVFQSLTADTAANRRRERTLQFDPRGESALRADFVARRGSLDPIEGIWRDGALRVGVVRSRAASDTLLAIVLRSDTTAWPVGAVRARFVRDADGSYQTWLQSRGFGMQQLTATLHRRTLLRFSPGMWGREYPLSMADAATAPLPDPRRPRLVVRERSVVVTVPSHDGPYQRDIDSLVAAHRDVLRSTPLIIIDLRGNEGGGSMTTRALHPYIVSADSRQTPYDSGRAVVLSSPELLAHVRRLGGPSPSAAVQRLIARMEAGPGSLVPAYDDETVTIPRVTPLDGPWKVAVLTDRGTVSAAEVTVLMALRSTRATTIGEPTAGALDYQSTAIIGLGTGDRRWALGFPTITAHADLPARGMRGKGIAPSIPLHWADVQDSYATVEQLILDRYPP